MEWHDSSREDRRQEYPNGFYRMPQGGMMDETKAASDEQIEAWSHPKTGIGLPYMGPVTFPEGATLDPDEWVYVKLEDIYAADERFLALIARIKSEQAKVQHFKYLVDQLEGEVEMLRRD